MAEVTQGGLPLGWNEPAPASKEEFVEVLEDALAAVRAGDSMEGFIEWHMPSPDPCPGCGGRGDAPNGGACPRCEGEGHTWREPLMEGADFELKARYRVGNSLGQGGVRAFTKERSHG